MCEVIIDHTTWQFEQHISNMTSAFDMCMHINRKCTQQRTFANVCVNFIGTLIDYLRTCRVHTNTNIRKAGATFGSVESVE